MESISRSHEGTGIGISLIKVSSVDGGHSRRLTLQELIKLHGGVLEIESLTAAESIDGSREHPLTIQVRVKLIKQTGLPSVYAYREHLHLR